MSFALTKISINFEETPKVYICIFSHLERSLKNWPLLEFSIESLFTGMVFPDHSDSKRLHPEIPMVRFS